MDNITGKMSDRGELESLGIAKRDDPYSGAATDVEERLLRVWMKELEDEGEKALILSLLLTIPPIILIMLWNKFSLGIDILVSFGIFLFLAAIQFGTYRILLKRFIYRNIRPKAVLELKKISNLYDWVNVPLIGDALFVWRFFDPDFNRFSKQWSIQISILSLPIIILIASIKILPEYNNSVYVSITALMSFFSFWFSINMERYFTTKQYIKILKREDTTYHAYTR